MKLILIALGANMGTPETALPAAWTDVVAALDLRHSRLSRLVRSRPAEAATGPCFANAVGLGYTSANPAAVLTHLHAIEAEFGRDRQREGHHGPRTLDLDLLAVGELRCEEPTLILPHPRLHQRDFVLVPLLELLPNWVDPRSGLPGRELLSALPADALTLLEDQGR